VRKKTALVLDALRAAVQAIPDNLPGRRDRALILVGFAAALRPSELARLDIAALTRHDDGIALVLPWRKNDQEAQGTTVWLPVGRTDLCPVRALEAWLAAAGITEGPLFRRLWRLPPPRVRRGAKQKSGAERYRIGSSPIDTDSVALVIKKWTGIAGLDGAPLPAIACGAGRSRAVWRRGSISPDSSSSPAMPRSRASRNMLSSMSYATITRSRTSSEEGEARPRCHHLDHPGEDP
jgi:integrase